MPTEKLLFIDTNIWLDFYRARKDAGLRLLKSVEALSAILSFARNHTGHRAVTSGAKH
jgi:hypothetical protein